MKRYIFVLGALLLLFFGCINLDVNGNGDNGDNGGGNGQVDLDPEFSVLYPSQGAEIQTITETADIEVLLQTLDITLTSPSSKNVHGQGHFVLSLDGGEQALVTYSTYVFEDVKLGEHTLTVEFVNNDGSSYSPQLKETIYFSVVLKPGVVIKPAEHAITLENNKFDPASLTIKQGDILVFTNKDTMPHAIQISKNNKAVASSENLKTGESYSFTMSETGVFTYSSMTIPSIKGTVTVEEK